MIVLKCSKLYSLVLAVHNMKNIYTVHTQVRMNTVRLVIFVDLIFRGLGSSDDFVGLNFVVYLP